MKQGLLSICILMSVLFSNAQGNPTKGYIVTEKGDTLKGEVKINPKKEIDSYNKVNFKDESGAQKNYKPNKIKAYGYDDQHFIAMDADGEKKFYKILSRGDINFYKFGYEGLRMNAVVFEVEYYIAHADNNELVLVKENKFKKQLTEWMKDNTEFINTYGDEKTFNADKALEIISHYNAWKANK